LLGAFGRSPDGSAINAFARLGAHRARMRPVARYRQAATDCGG
jgi:hypothetical protein